MKRTHFIIDFYAHLKLSTQFFSHLMKCFFLYRYSLDKLSGKAAKEMFEHGHKLEAEYRHLVTAVVSAGANVAHVCAQVKAAVDAEHRKSQWVPAATLH